MAREAPAVLAKARAVDAGRACQVDEPRDDAGDARVDGIRVVALRQRRREAGTSESGSDGYRADHAAERAETPSDDTSLGRPRRCGWQATAVAAPSGPAAGGHGHKAA